jgi:hypothetical protein
VEASADAWKLKFVLAGVGCGKLTRQQGSTAESPGALAFERARLQHACVLLLPGMRHSPPRANAAPPRSAPNSAAVINPEVKRFNIVSREITPDALLGQALS